MIKLTTILLLISLQSFATDYYVSNSGSDAANGLTTGTAWQTIAKVNSFTFSPGDNIYFKRGDVWNESLRSTVSGTAGNLITYGAYGTGANPKFTAFQTLTGWATAGGNIWTSTFANSVKKLNNVYINGAIRALGRYPNTTFLTSSYGNAAKNQMKTGLTGTPNYVGAEIVIRTNAWTMDRAYITSQPNGDTLNFTPATYYTLGTGKEYFLQNHISTLDLQNEWCYDTTTKVISVYSTTEPTGKASSIDTLIYLNGKDYINIDGIDLEGANITGLEMLNSNHSTFKNGIITYSGQFGVKGEGVCSYFTFINNTVQDSWNGGVFLNYLGGQSQPIDLGTSHHAVITGNTVRNSNVSFGMANSGFDCGNGITIYGGISNISNNIIKNSSYLGLRFQGDTNIIRNNWVDSFCILKHDGGGIYTFSVTPNYKAATGSRVVSNIVTNGIQNKTLTANSAPQIFSFYLDGNTSDVHIDIDSNTAYNSDYLGLIINYNRYVNVRHNNFFNAASNQFIIYNNNNLNANINFIGNSLYSSIADNGFGNTVLSNLNNFGQAMSNFGTMDSNYYSRPQSYQPYVKKSNVTYYSQPEWAATGYDTHGGGTPINTTTATALFKVNTTMSPAVETLAGTYYDSRGNTYNNSITLQPFTSALLFKATQDIIPSTGYNQIRIKFKKVKR